MTQNDLRSSVLLSVTALLSILTSPVALALAWPEAGNFSKQLEPLAGDEDPGGQER